MSKSIRLKSPFYGLFFLPFISLFFFHPGLQPTEPDGRFLVSGGVGLYIQDRSPLDHIDSSDFDDILFSSPDFDHGHPQGIGPMRASGGKNSTQAVIKKRFCMESEAF